MSDRYRVVINHEEQYSIWPTDRQIPRGWTEVGASGDRSRCTTHIERVWTELHPLTPEQRSRRLHEMEQLIRRDAG